MKPARNRGLRPLRSFPDSINAGTRSSPFWSSICIALSSTGGLPYDLHSGIATAITTSSITKVPKLPPYADATEPRVSHPPALEHSAAQLTAVATIARGQIAGAYYL